MFYQTDADWTRRCQSVVDTMLQRHGAAGLRPDNFGFVALREGPEGAAPQGFAWRGEWRVYPCSIVKAFHLVHALHAIDSGVVEDHPEMTRAMRDMIRWSSNGATNYVIDLITGTTGDTLLFGAEFDAWVQRREALNRFFTTGAWSGFAADFAQCNITQKLMDDMRYGREAQFAGALGQNLNALTPIAPARLFHELFSGKVPLSPTGRRRAHDILRRDRRGEDASRPTFQVAHYLGGGMPDDATLWSKAGQNGWTGDARASYFKHDLIRVERPGAAAVTLCLMTQGKGVCEDHPLVFPEIGALCAERLLG